MDEMSLSNEEVTLSEEDRDQAKSEMESLQQVIDSLANGDGERPYAETGDSMERLDTILGGQPWYDELKQQRVEFSKQLMAEGSEDKESVQQFVNWCEEVNAHL